ncbi:radical SAM protein, partial [Candidatus Roizmanbacteria bacterium]|nr:radical SAM protein [Candidatus Roizmanbacteria bacterium]
MKYFVKTFGCQQNHADSERIDAAFHSRGMKKAKGYNDADYIVINTCMVRESAENRVYGLVNNLGKMKSASRRMKIIVTGCMVGLAFRDKTGKYLKRIRELMPEVDEFMPIEEIGFDNSPVRQDDKHAWIPISNGCNNFCTFCVVPFTRGREISRPYEDIIKEAKKLKAKGYTHIMLLGQNVNSYGADLILGEKNIQVMRDINKTYFENSKLNPENSRQKSKLQTNNQKYKNIKPVYVKHLGRYRIPTLFPALLEEIAQ